MSLWGCRHASVFTPLEVWDTQEAVQAPLSVSCWISLLWLIFCRESAVESSCAPVITQAKKTTAFTDLLGEVFGKHLDVLQLWPMDRAWESFCILLNLEGLVNYSNFLWIFKNWYFKDWPEQLFHWSLMWNGRERKDQDGVEIMPLERNSYNSYKNFF